ncbi:unnamed protein product [Amoebophrya sp. A25]|nr:unnamed protein product [Amoebophrya sp. A25]|eukprot:GSA25T00016069001.1
MLRNPHRMSIAEFSELYDEVEFQAEVKFLTSFITIPQLREVVQLISEVNPETGEREFSIDQFVRTLGWLSEKVVTPRDLVYMKSAASHALTKITSIEEENNKTVVLVMQRLDAIFKDSQEVFPLLLRGESVSSYGDRARTRQEVTQTMSDLLMYMGPQQPGATAKDHRAVGKHELEVARARRKAHSQAARAKNMPPPRAPAIAIAAAQMANPQALDDVTSVTSDYLMDYASDGASVVEDEDGMPGLRRRASGTKQGSSGQMLGKDEVELQKRADEGMHPVWVPMVETFSPIFTQAEYEQLRLADKIKAIYPELHPNHVEEHPDAYVIGQQHGLAGWSCHAWNEFDSALINQCNDWTDNTRALLSRRHENYHRRNVEEVARLEGLFKQVKVGFRTRNDLPFTGFYFGQARRRSGDLSSVEPSAPTNEGGEAITEDPAKARRQGRGSSSRLRLGSRDDENDEGGINVKRLAASVIQNVRQSGLLACLPASCRRRILATQAGHWCCGGRGPGARFVGGANAAAQAVYKRVGSAASVLIGSNEGHTATDGETDGTQSPGSRAAGGQRLERIDTMSSVVAANMFAMTPRSLESGTPRGGDGREDGASVGGGAIGINARGGRGQGSECGDSRRISKMSSASALSAASLDSAGETGGDGAGADAGAGGENEDTQSMVFFRELINAALFPSECVWCSIALLHAILMGLELETRTNYNGEGSDASAGRSGNDTWRPVELAFLAFFLVENYIRYLLFIQLEYHGDLVLTLGILPLRKYILTSTLMLPCEIWYFIRCDPYAGFDLFLICVAGFGNISILPFRLPLVQFLRFARHDFARADELWLLLQGMQSAVRTLFWVGIGGTIMIYVITIFGMLLLRDQNFPGGEEYFGTLSRGFVTVMQVATFDGWSSVAKPMVDSGNVSFMFFACIIMLMNFGLLNIVIGIFCETAYEILDERRKRTDMRTYSEMRADMSNLRSRLAEYLSFDTEGEVYMDRRLLDKMLTMNPKRRTTQGNDGALGAPGGSSAAFHIAGLSHKELQVILDTLDVDPTEHGEQQMAEFFTALEAWQRQQVRAIDLFALRVYSEELLRRVTRLRELLHSVHREYGRHLPRMAHDLHKAKHQLYPKVVKQDRFKSAIRRTLMAQRMSKVLGADQHKKLLDEAEADLSKWRVQVRESDGLQSQLGHVYLETSDHRRGVPKDDDVEASSRRPSASVLRGKSPKLNFHKLASAASGSRSLDSDASQGISGLFSGSFTAMKAAKQLKRSASAASSRRGSDASDPGCTPAKKAVSQKRRVLNAEARAAEVPGLAPTESWRMKEWGKRTRAVQATEFLRAEFLRRRTENLKLKRERQSAINLTSLEERAAKKRVREEGTQNNKERRIDEARKSIITGSSGVFSSLFGGGT